jgi:Mrp family chromosome partitioning ATPase/capsular polysaccharide biosynthesis protein
MQLSKFIKLLYKRKYVLVVVPLVAVIITYFLVRKLPDTYRSHARISTGLVDQSQQILNSEILSQELKIQQGFSNLIEILRLKKTFDQLSYRLIIHDLTDKKPYRQASKLVKQLNPSARAHALEVYREKLAKRESLSLWDDDQKGLNLVLASMGYDEVSLQKKIITYRVGNSDFIDVEFESENPFLSAYVVNTLINEFFDYYGIYIKNNQQRTTNLLDTLMKQKYEVMSEKMKELRDYKIKNRVLNLNEQSRILFSQITDFETRLQVAKRDVAAYNAAIKGINDKFDPKDRKYLESVVVDINQKIIGTREQLKQATADLIKSNYGAKQKAKQDSIRKVLGDEILENTDRLITSPLVTKQNLISQLINTELSRDIAEGSIPVLESEIRDLNEKFDILVPHEATIQNYERGVDVAGREYLDMQNRYNRSNLESSVGISLRQVEMAMPGPPIPSKKMLLVALSGIVSFVFCFVTLFVIFYLDNSIQNVQDLANQTKMPVLSYLPFINTAMLDLTEVWKNQSQTNRKTIAFKNLIRSLRFELEREMGGKKILAITSVVPEEGKSLIALGLAFAYSMVNKKVLLIDGNFDKPTITETTNTPFYVEDFFKNRISVAEIMNDTKISVLGNRGADISLFEFCEESIVKPKLAYVRDMFDVIIIEAPALDKLNKSREWIVLSDKVLGVFQAGATIRQNRKQHVAYLERLGPAFAGWVLNKVSINRLEKVPK